MMLLARSFQSACDLKTRLEDACEGGKIYEWRLTKAGLSGTLPINYWTINVAFCFECLIAPDHRTGTFDISQR